MDGRPLVDAVLAHVRRLVSVVAVGGQGPVRRGQVEVPGAEVGPQEAVVVRQRPPRPRVDVRVARLVPVAPPVGALRAPVVHATLRRPPPVRAPRPPPGPHLHAKVPLEPVLLDVAVPREGPRRLRPLRGLVLGVVAAVREALRLLLSGAVPVYVGVHSGLAGGRAAGGGDWGRRRGLWLWEEPEEEKRVGRRLWSRPLWLRWRGGRRRGRVGLRPDPEKKEGTRERWEDKTDMGGFGSRPPPGEQDVYPFVLPLDRSPRRTRVVLVSSDAKGQR